MGRRALRAQHPGPAGGVMTSRFLCILTRADELACERYARVTITDTEGGSARACPRHAVAALDGITGARVDWADSLGLNEYERKALELSEERSQLSATQPVPEPDAEPGRSAGDARPSAADEAERVRAQADGLEAGAWMLPYVQYQPSPYDLGISDDPEATWRAEPEAEVTL
jgi:hypothetical protein